MKFLFGPVKKCGTAASGGQIGYVAGNVLQDGFVQIWNVTYLNDTMVENVAFPVSLGNHTFSMHEGSGTTWAFAMDVVVQFTYYMHSKIGVYQIIIAVEEITCSSYSFPFPNLFFSNAFSLLQNEAWKAASQGYIDNFVEYLIPWGVEGQIQNPEIQCK